MVYNKGQLSRRHYLGLTASVGAAGLSGCLEGGQSPSLDEVKENAETVEYETLYRNIDEYEGNYVHYSGLRITDVMSGEGTKEYLMMFTDGGWGDERVFYGTWNGNPFREDDEIEVWGVVRGLETYTSLTGEKTVPEIELVDIKLIEGA